MPATILWPELDPLFPPHWSDRLGDFFSEATLHACREPATSPPGGAGTAASAIRDAPRPG